MTNPTALAFLLAEVRVVRGPQGLWLHRTRAGWLIARDARLSSPGLVYDRSAGPLYVSSPGTPRGVNVWAFLRHFIDVIKPEMRERICFSLCEAFELFGEEWGVVAGDLKELNL